MSPHCKQHENKKVDKKSVEFVCFVLNITKIPHKKNLALWSFTERLTKQYTQKIDVYTAVDL